MPYLTEVVGIEAAVAGLVVFLPKAWDFVLNPLAGRVSDRSTNPRAGYAARCRFIARAGGGDGRRLRGDLRRPDRARRGGHGVVVVAFLAAATAYAFEALHGDVGGDHGGLRRKPGNPADECRRWS